MTHSQSAGEDNPLPEDPRGKRLDSWKEIAAYLKRDVATVRRWEKREALAVHRHLHEKLGTVFAYTSELDAWAEGRRRQLEQVQPGEITPFAVVPSGLRALPWAIAGLLACGLGLVLMLWAPWRRPPVAAPLRISTDLGADVSLAPANVQFGDAVVLSPDGSVLVFVAQKGTDSPQLYVRPLNQLQAVPLAGTDDALSPFFSPDGKWIGFFARGKLKKIAVTGGAVIPLADAPTSRGGTWSEDDTIVFSPRQFAGTQLLRVPSGGGKVDALTPLVEDEVIQTWPQMLPGGKAVLFTSGSTIGAYNSADLVVQSLPGGTRKVVQSGGYHGRYLPSGHLIFMHDGTLFAAPFNLDRLEVGQPVPALTGVNSNSLTGGAQVSVSAGTLVYLPGRGTGAAIPIEWMDRQGKTTPLRTTPANWVNLRFAPDSQRLAMEIRDGTSHIWVYDLSREMLARLTASSTPDEKPVWTPDGRRITFASPRASRLTGNLYWQRADGSGETQRLTESNNTQLPSSWHPDGRFLAFEETTAETKVDVMILPMEGNDATGWTPGKPWPFANGPFVEYDPMFSPDGRWLAYSSVESGHPEVYVRPFPGPGGKWLIGAGANPTWSRTKPELFYGANGQIMVAGYNADATSFRAGKSVPWSERRYQTRGTIRMFDLHPDGDRIALAPAAQAAAGAKPERLVFVINFLEELRRLAPAPR